MTAMFWRTNFSISAGLRPLKSAPKRRPISAVRVLRFSGRLKHLALSISFCTATATFLSRRPFASSASTSSWISASFLVALSMMSITFFSSRRESGAESDAVNEAALLPSTADMPSAA